MFPTSSYFRGFNCPYYISGLCERPYCHYRHGGSALPDRLSTLKRYYGELAPPAAPTSARDDPRTQRHAPRPSNSEYTPTPLPVLDQMRAAGILPSLEALEAEDKAIKPPAAAKPSAAPHPPAAPQPSVAPKPPAAIKRPSDPPAAIIQQPPEPPAPPKVPRVEISPFDYLKNIIEGKKVAPPPSFTAPVTPRKVTACTPPGSPTSPSRTISSPLSPTKTTSSAEDTESDSNSPVKSLLLPPVEIDYAPAFQVVDRVKPEAASPSKSPRVAPAFACGKLQPADFSIEPVFASDDSNEASGVDLDAKSPVGATRIKEEEAEDEEKSEAFTAKVEPEEEKEGEEERILRAAEKNEKIAREIVKIFGDDNVSVAQVVKPRAVAEASSSLTDIAKAKEPVSVASSCAADTAKSKAQVSVVSNRVTNTVRPTATVVDTNSRVTSIAILKEPVVEANSHVTNVAQVVKLKDPFGDSSSRTTNTVKFKEPVVETNSHVAQVPKSKDTVSETAHKISKRKESFDDNDDDVVIVKEVVKPKESVRTKEATKPKESVKLEEIRTKNTALGSKLKLKREQLTPPKTREVTEKISLSGDNIFTRLSSLTTLVQNEEENEYVPSFVGKVRCESAEYTPSTSKAKDADEYVPQFLSFRAAKTKVAEYEPAELVDLTRTPPKDKNSIDIPLSDGEEEEEVEEIGGKTKVTRSRSFIRERTLKKEKLKKKKKKKRQEQEEEEEPPTKKKKKKVKKEPQVEKNEKEVFRSLFGSGSDDDFEDFQEAPSSSRTAKAPSFVEEAQEAPSSSRGAQTRTEPEPQMASYFDPVRQKWYREDGSEDTARGAASSSSSSSIASSKKPAQKSRNPFQLNARDVMHKRMQWFEQLKMEAAAKKAKPTGSAVTSKAPDKSGPAPGPEKKTEGHKARLTGAQKPTMPLNINSKIPLEVRRRYLEVFVDECLKIYDVDTDAYQRALQEEQTACERSSNRTVYLNVVINARKRLIREHQAPRPSSGGPERQTVSHQAVLGGRLAAEGNFGMGLVSARTIDQRVTEALAGDGFYDGLLKYCLTEEQYMENGFPIAVGNGEVDLPGAEEKLKRMLTKNENERICSRCGKTFRVDEDGEQLEEDECLYHWGKAWKRRVPGQGVEQRYTCCGSDTSVKWCELASCHVHESNRYTDLSHYKRTPARNSSKGRRSLAKGVFALDCEMVYTTMGSELARVTVVDRKSDAAYERLVRPVGRIVDYNSRFSGLKAEDFEHPDVTSIGQVQKDLRRLFNADTILIGHSLESDLIALKMCHEKIVDTSVVFPHRLGPPKKRALKNLASEILQKIIQADAEGHDSKEDAAACMELMLHQLRMDLRKNFRTGGAPI